MKKFIYVILAFALALFTGCKEKDEVQHRIIGEWMYTDEEAGQVIEIYLAFGMDGRFELFQKIGDGAHRYLKGTYQVDKTIVSGVYSDGTPWASDYEVRFIDGNLHMMSTSAEGYSVTYRKTRIPDEVKNHFVDMTKSSAEEILPFL